MEKRALDPQQWIFPQAGAESAPNYQTSVFGPVHLHDKMIFNWDPPTKPAIDVQCFGETGWWSNGTKYTISINAPPPVEFFFDQFPARNGTDKVFCHGFFNETKLGNTVVWEFVEEPAPLPLTWPNNTNIRSTKNAETTKVPHSKSIAISVGVGIGVAIAILLIVGVISFFLRRCLARNRKTEQTGQLELENTQLPHDKSVPVKTASAPDSKNSKERPELVELSSYENQLVELPATPERHNKT